MREYIMILLALIFTFNLCHCQNLDVQKETVYTDINFALEHKDDVKILKLSNKDLVLFPDEIFQLSNLNVLVLSHNSIKEIPPEIDQLTKLKYLFIDDNPIEILPNSLSNIKSLERLFITTNNYIEEDIVSLELIMKNCTFFVFKVLDNGKIIMNR